MWWGHSGVSSSLASASRLSAGSALFWCSSALRSWPSAKAKRLKDARPEGHEPRRRGAYSKMHAFTPIRDALLVLAAAPFIYYLLAIYAALRFFSVCASQASSAGAPLGFAPPISILKPIRGLDRET